MKKYVVITCANKKIGNFVTSHWLRSLKENVNLKNIDIIVIDYGLTIKQKKYLIEKGVTIYQGESKYHIVNKRFFDAGKFINKSGYEQILFIDGGDIIFQDDISQIFEKNKNDFRVVVKNTMFFKWNITNNFGKNIQEKIWKTLKNKKIINAGVIFAPKDKFIALSKCMKKLIKNKNAFGPDQVVLNYHLYKDKFISLDNRYNFILPMEEKGFFVKNGVFYKSNHNKIAIVHNAGQMELTRVITNFGYGGKHNQIKHLVYALKRTQYKILADYKEFFE